jgi:hypothetical protein
VKLVGVVFVKLFASIGPAMLAALLHACAVHLAPPMDAVQVAVIEHESGSSSWAIGDNNAHPHRSYEPTSYSEAVTIATLLVQNDVAIGGRGIDLGIGQVNSHNLAAHGITIADVLHPCQNLSVSSSMLKNTFDSEYAAYAYLPEPVRTWTAIDATLEVYNSGDRYGAPQYARDVEKLLNGAFVRSTVAALRAPAAAPNQVWRFIGIGDPMPGSRDVAPRRETNPQAFVQNGEPHRQ